MNVMLVLIIIAILVAIVTIRVYHEHKQEELNKQAHIDEWNRQQQILEAKAKISEVVASVEVAKANINETLIELPKIKKTAKVKPIGKLKVKTKAKPALKTTKKKSTKK
jgi:type II secretory pathway pseudopilin PulG